MGVEIARFEAQQMGKHRLAEIGHDALTNDRDAIEAGAAGHGHDGGDADDQPAILAHHIDILGHEALIDRAAQNGGNGQRGNGRDQEEQDGQRQPHRIAQQERQQAPQGLELPRRGLDFRNDLVGVRCCRNGLICHCWNTP
ncbi:hypothetical protein D3C87_1797490 [compost metagenome]